MKHSKRNKKKVEDIQLSKILVLPDKKILKTQSDQSLLDLFLSNGIEISHLCEGMASCTTCRVKIHSPSIERLPPRIGQELESAQARGFAENERLACQLPIIDGLEVEIPHREAHSET